MSDKKNKSKNFLNFHIWSGDNLSGIWIQVAMILEKAMASHSSTLAWKIPWTEEPGGLQSMELQRVGHDWSDLEKKNLLNL